MSCVFAVAGLCYVILQKLCEGCSLSPPHLGRPSLQCVGGGRGDLRPWRWNWRLLAVGTQRMCPRFFLCFCHLHHQPQFCFPDSGLFFPPLLSGNRVFNGQGVAHTALCPWSTSLPPLSTCGNRIKKTTLCRVCGSRWQVSALRVTVGGQWGHSQ